jgi:asparagine synthase (glutamine-hydrolysing)
MITEAAERIRVQHPKSVINSKEAAYHFQRFRRFHPQNSVLKSIGIWTGFDFNEERASVRGTLDGSWRPTAV